MFFCRLQVSSLTCFSAEFKLAPLHVFFCRLFKLAPLRAFLQTLLHKVPLLLGGVDVVRASGLHVKAIITSVAAKQDSVHHDELNAGTGARNCLLQGVVVVREVPEHTILELTG